jgi:hypothetical protein
MLSDLVFLSKLAWQYHPWSLMAAVVFALCALWWLWRTPSPGKAVTAMGVIAVIATVRSDMTDREKVFWVILTFILLAIETRAIKLERENSARIFERIGQGITGAIDSSKEHFDATMKTMSAVLASVTGGDSYSVVMPLLIGKPDTAVPLRIENHGDNILNGVTVTIYNTGVWMEFSHESIISSVNNRIKVGILAPSEKLVLSGAQINPEQLMQTEHEGHKVFRAFLYIGAQNYTVRECLDFKRDDNNKWLFRFAAYKYGPHQKDILLEAVDWSEDINTPNRVTEVNWS